MGRLHAFDAAPAPAIRRRNAGFTLVEIVVSIVLLGILTAVGSNMISNSAIVANVSNARQTSMSQSRYGVERLAREIREVRLNGGAYDITTRTASALTFTKSDGVVVSIALAGSTLSLGYPGSSAVLTNQANAFSLSYLKADGATASTDNTDLRFVQISLTIQDSANGTTSAQRTRVALRNAPGPVGI